MFSFNVRGGSRRAGDGQPHLLPSRRHTYGQDDDDDDCDAEMSMGSNTFPAAVPTRHELRMDKTMQLEMERVDRSRGGPKTTADKALTRFLGVEVRREGIKIPGNTNPNYLQGAVVGSVEIPFEHEYERRCAIPQSERVGALGPLEAMRVEPNTFVFMRRQRTSASPLGYPDIQGFSHLGGLSKHDLRELVLLGVALIPQKISDTTSQVITVCFNGTPHVPYTGTAPIAPFTHLRISTKPAVVETEDGIKPAMHVAGHHPMSQLPTVRPWNDLDVGALAAEIDETIYNAADSFRGGDAAAWFRDVKAALRTHCFNDDDYDVDDKLPIQFYADWSMLVELTSNMTSISGTHGSMFGHMETEINRILKEQDECQDFREDADALCDEIDDHGREELKKAMAHIKGVSGALDDAATKALAKHTSTVKRFILRQRNSALMEQWAWEARMVGPRNTNWLTQGSHIDLLG